MLTQMKALFRGSTTTDSAEAYSKPRFGSYFRGHLEGGKAPVNDGEISSQALATIVLELVPVEAYMELVNERTKPMKLYDHKLS